MTSRSEHPSYFGKLGEPQHTTTADEPLPSALPPLDISALIRAERSCCCTAKPAVVAMIPPSSGRERATDLLLCMHHYRASSQALATVGAVVADRCGHVLQATARQPSRQVVSALSESRTSSGSRFTSGV
jgi:hypothetical protein